MTTASQKPSLLDQALALQQKGDISGAEAGFRAIIKRNPHDSDALVLLGMLLQKTKRAVAAIKLIERGIAAASKAGRKTEPAWRIVLAYAKRDAGDNEAALGEIDDLLASVSDNPDFLFIRGELLQRLGRHREAIQSLESVLKRAPENAYALNNLGVSLRATGRQADAFSVFHKAVELKPNHVQAALNAGQILKDLAVPGAPVKLLELAQSRASKNRNAELALIDVLSMAGMVEEAENLACKALQRHPGDPELSVQLGDIRLSDGDRKAAAELAKTALETRPEMPAALALLAEAGGGEEAMELFRRIETIIRKGRHSASLQASLNVSAGRLCEQLGRYDDAFAYFSAGNKMRKAIFASADLRYDQVRTETEVAELINAYPAATRGVSGGNKSTLPVFIIGMPRSGTTLTEQILASHPDISGAGERSEVGNIARWLRREHGYPGQLDSEILEQAAAGYLAVLHRTDPAANRVTDKMPGNFLHAGLIARMLPDARIIHCRRDAMDTCLSCFVQNFRSDGLLWSCDLEDLGHYYCQYQRIMNHWRATLPPGRMIEVNYEDVVTNLEREARRLIEFVGLEWDDSCLRFHETERTVSTASRNQVRKELYTTSVNKWRRYGGGTEPLARVLAGCGHGPSAD